MPKRYTVQVSPTPEFLADLDLIREAYGGVKPATAADAIREAVRREAEQARAESPKKKEKKPASVS